MLTTCKFYIQRLDCKPKTLGNMHTEHTHRAEDMHYRL